MKLVEYAVTGDKDFGTAPAASLYLANDRASGPELVSALDGRSTAASFPDLISAIGDSIRADAEQ